MTTTRTHTRTNTFTVEEKAVIKALTPRLGRDHGLLILSGDELFSRLQEDLEGNSDLKIDRDLCMTVTGQLIERGKVTRIHLPARGRDGYKVC